MNAFESFWRSTVSWWPWQTPQDFLGSDFFAGLFGAAVGAIAAYLFSARSERRTSRLQEIARANAAIALAHSVVNTAVTLKKQHTKGLYEEYLSEREKALQAIAAGQTGITVNMNMMTLALPYLPGPEAQDAVTAGVLHSPRAQIISIHMRQSVDSLKQAVETRNALVLEFKPLPQQQKVPLYLGLPNPNGVDLRYPNSMEGLAHNVDDCIYFAMLLQELLKAHVDRLRRKLWWRAPSPLTFDYAKANEFLPDRSGFPEFESQFRKTETRWEKLKRFPKRWWAGV